MPRWVKFGCLGVVILQCVVGGALLALGRWIAAPLEGAAVACSGSPVPGAAAGPLRVLAFARADHGDAFYPRPALVTGWTAATTAAEATVVLCLERDEPTTVETCNYGDGSTFIRVRHARTVRAVSAVDGHVLSELAVQGDEPAACPASVETGGGGPSVGIRVMGIPVATVGGGGHEPSNTQLDGGDVVASHVYTAFAGVLH